MPIFNLTSLFFVLCLRLKCFIPYFKDEIPCSVAGLPLTINGPSLRLYLHASHPDIEKRPVTVDFKLLRSDLKLYRSLPTIKLNKQEWMEVKFNVEEEIGQEFILLIRVNRTWNPYREAGISDLRNLGVAITTPQFSSEK
jgi:hypothetical protein